MHLFDYESEARKLGKTKGVRFRKYDRWGAWPIKAYEYPPRLNPLDFKTWKEAYDWIRGEAEE